MDNKGYNSENYINETAYIPKSEANASFNNDSTIQQHKCKIVDD